MHPATPRYLTPFHPKRVPHFFTDVLIVGGGLAGALTNDVTLYNGGRLLTNGGGIPRLTLSVNPSTGVLSGSFEDTGRTAAIKGVVLQEQTNAAGFFLGTNAAGSFLLTP